jgi:DNA-binding transcriptional ArsR family regulator
MRNITLKQLLWYLLAGTRGGYTRARIIHTVIEEPKNTHQISKSLGLDFKTVKHHTKILTEHNLLKIFNKDNYGAVYFISDELEGNIELFHEIWNKFGK